MPSIVAYSFKSLHAGRQRQVNLHELEASVVDTVSYRTAWGLHSENLSQNNNNKKQQKKKSKTHPSPIGHLFLYQHKFKYISPSSVLKTEPRVSDLRGRYSSTELCSQHIFFYFETGYD